MELYTIKEMAKLVKIPESTARYYKDRHPEYFHYTGKGHKKRYTPDTLEALRFIRDQANNSRNAEEISTGLQARFNREINTTDINAVTTAEEQQLSLMNTLTTTLSSIADQKKEIQSLRDDIKELKEYIKNNRLSWWQKLLNKKT